MNSFYVEYMLEGIFRTYVVMFVFMICQQLCLGAVNRTLNVLNAVLLES